MTLRGPVLPPFASRHVEVPPSPPGSRDIDARREVLRTIFADVTLVGTVGQTTKPWSAIDVYVSLPILTTPEHSTLSVFVWAITAGVRVLAGSGRVCPGQAAGPANVLQQAVWVASARGQADTWETTAVWEQNSALAVPSGAVQFTVCASNEPSDVPAGIGTVLLANAIGFAAGAIPALTQLHGFYPSQFELVSVEASIGVGVAVPRFLHVHDLATAVAGAIGGALPIFCFPMGATGGSGVVVHGINYRARELLTVIPSSTLATTTAVADCLVQAVVR